MGSLSGELLATLQTSVSDVAGPFRIERATPVAGGCIHRCFMLHGGGHRYLARKNGLGRDLVGKGERLAEALPRLLSQHAPAASLLHGDLWSGNSGFLADGTPVLFDPAVYCGDRETDIAMTELFGGFPQAFYSAYREAAPLDHAYAVRKTLYNLYHVLNHANLFGGGYAAQAETMIDRLLAEVR